MVCMQKRQSRQVYLYVQVQCVAPSLACQAAALVAVLRQLGDDIFQQALYQPLPCCFSHHCIILTLLNHKGLLSLLCWAAAILPIQVISCIMIG